MKNKLSLYRLLLSEFPFSDDKALSLLPDMGGDTFHLGDLSRDFRGTKAGQHVLLILAIS